MPKKVIVVAGRKVFSFDMGMPRSRHIARNEDINCQHCDVDLAKIMKSFQTSCSWTSVPLGGRCHNIMNQERKNQEDDARHCELGLT